MLTKSPKSKKPRSWKLQDAKTHFSEVVRRARSEGPQRVTVHRKDAAVVISPSDYEKARSVLEGKGTGTLADLIPVMQKGRRLGLRLKRRPIYLTARPPFQFPDDFP